MNKLKQTTIFLLSVIMLSSCSDDSFDEINQIQKDSFDLRQERLRSEPSSNAGVINIVESNVTITQTPDAYVQPFFHDYSLKVDFSNIILSVGETVTGNVWIMNSDDVNSPETLRQFESISISDSNLNDEYEYDFPDRTGGSISDYLFMKVVVDRANGDRSSVIVPIEQQ